MNLKKQKTIERITDHYYHFDNVQIGLLSVGTKPGITINNYYGADCGMKIIPIDAAQAEALCNVIRESAWRVSHGKTRRFTEEYASTASVAITSPRFRTIRVLITDNSDQALIISGVGAIVKIPTYLFPETVCALENAITALNTPCTINKGLIAEIPVMPL